MTLTRLALAGLLVAGSLVLVAFLLASVSDDPPQASSGITSDEPMLSPALERPPTTSGGTRIVPPRVGGVPGVAIPTERRCSEPLPTDGAFETATVTKC